jgi:hypothetical protein
MIEMHLTAFISLVRRRFALTPALSPRRGWETLRATMAFVLPEKATPFSPGEKVATGRMRGSLSMRLVAGLETTCMEGEPVMVWSL